MSDCANQTELIAALASADPATLRALSTLVGIMARLRDPERGCPWDVQQDFASIAPYTIEEAYEVADAIERGDLAELRDELGDLLLQVVFHARMAEEQGAFALRDVAEAINDKMIRRHPHVFAGASVADAEAQTRAWEASKAAERAGSGDRSVLAGIARGLPEWMRATKLQKRAASVGFDWPNVDPVFAKLSEELLELKAEFEALDQAVDSAQRAAVESRLEDELGDVLFVAANLARHAKLDPGRALRRANAKFERRFRRMEVLAEQRGLQLCQLPLEAQDQLWDEAKREERQAD
ncbi:nucleoside triphosphate pyrophosphohydrolase [Pseudomarimonas arenosa]|uniref:Nucleoside triphosphate pyrophosphohydrolase n=1 Tax=Pseudomarimonas arenosa TaxID=2774145 RepID=A0AAW3ZKV0_9GAMM|nr:nucleoside triphosphate pyrophosphohydrolase [Pseudomarimonas arenosa]MBD8525550.1 nucleoside triphosphate pyrophosphohydrolase [Pseudomarimonas arenosa]